MLTLTDLEAKCERGLSRYILMFTNALTNLFFVIILLTKATNWELDENDTLWEDKHSSMYRYRLKNSRNSELQKSELRVPPPPTNQDSRTSGGKIWNYRYPPPPPPRTLEVQNSRTRNPPKQDCRTSGGKIWNYRDPPPPLWTDKLKA